MKEAKRFNDVNSSNEILCVGIKSLSMLDELFGEVTPLANSFERPDIILIANDRILLIEHFEFDDSTEIQKSSAIKKEKAKIQRELFHSIRDNENEMPTLQVNKINARASLENYENNLLRNFDSHVKKHENYLKNYYNNKKQLIKRGLFNDKVEFGLFIEETSGVPSTMKDGTTNSLYKLLPFYLNSFIERLKFYSYVKHIFFSYKGGHRGEKHLNYYYYNNDNLGCLKGLTISPKDEFISFELEMISSFHKVTTRREDEIIR